MTDAQDANMVRTVAVILLFSLIFVWDAFVKHHTEVDAIIRSQAHQIELRDSVNKINIANHKIDSTKIAQFYETKHHNKNSGRLRNN
jgi:hypothetical protein